MEGGGRRGEGGVEGGGRRKGVIIGGVVGEKGPGTGLHIRVVELQGQVQETTMLPLQVSTQTRPG